MIDVSGKKKKQIIQSNWIWVLCDTWDATMQFLIIYRFKTTFSNCKTILSIISMHWKKNSITEMNYKKHCLQFTLKKKKLYGNSITVLIKNRIRIQGVIQKFFLGSISTKKWDHNCDQGLIKSSWRSAGYTCSSEFMLRLHRGKFVNVKWGKTTILAALQVAKYIKTVK